MRWFWQLRRRLHWWWHWSPMPFTEPPTAAEITDFILTYIEAMDAQGSRQ